MQLFTITATPVRGRHQVEASSDAVLNEINEQAIRTYPDLVASKLSRRGFDGFTIYKVDGYWQGVPEVSFKIEIAIDGHEQLKWLYQVCEDLRAEYNQDAVMLTTPNNTVEFIEA